MRKIIRYLKNSAVEFNGKAVLMKHIADIQDNPYSSESESELVYLTNIKFQMKYNNICRGLNAKEKCYSYLQRISI